MESRIIKKNISSSSLGPLLVTSCPNWGGVCTFLSGCVLLPLKTLVPEQSQDTMTEDLMTERGWVMIPQRPPTQTPAIETEPIYAVRIMTSLPMTGKQILLLHMLLWRLLQPFPFYSRQEVVFFKQAKQMITFFFPVSLSRSSLLVSWLLRSEMHARFKYF